MSFLLILATLTAIVWLAIALRELDLLTAKGQSIIIFVKMTGLALPNIMALIAPNALLIAYLYTLDRLNGDSELIIMSSSGVPVWRFATPLLALASLVTVALIIANFWLMPLSLRTLQSYVTQVRTDLISQVLRPGLFSSPEKQLTFHIRDRAGNGDLLGLVVHDERTPGRAMTYLAKTGHIINSGDSAYLVMRDGQIHRRIDKAGESAREVSIGEFKEYIFDISQFGPKAGVAELKPRQRYLSELLYPEAGSKLYAANPGSFRSEIHSRFSSLLYPVIFALIALNFLGHARTVREGRWKSIVLAFGIAVGIRIGGLASINLLTLQPSAVALVYGIPIGAILVAALATHVRMAPHARLGLNLALPDKVRIYLGNFWGALGVKREQQHGRVG